MTRITAGSHLTTSSASPGYNIDMGSIGNGTSQRKTDGYSIEDHPLGEARPLKVICIGAGATGLNLAYRTKRHLKNVDLLVYEKNKSIGGTWFENKYPGIAVSTREGGAKGCDSTAKCHGDTLMILHSFEGSPKDCIDFRVGFTEQLSAEILTIR